MSLNHFNFESSVTVYYLTNGDRYSIDSCPERLKVEAPMKQVQST